jgi:hypothetical protein
MQEHGGFAEDYSKVGESKDFPKGGMQEHGGFAEDYSKVGESKDFPKGGMQEYGGFAEDYPGRRVQRLPQWRDAGARRLC